MEKVPVYAENIIVGIIFKKEFQWYITNRNYWYMDNVKLEKAYINEGSDIDVGDYSERFGIAILNEDTAEYFLSQITDCQISAQHLRAMMKKRIEEIEYFDDILNFSPNFFVDFDQRRFFSLYPEMICFENYVPEGWNGEYRDFYSDIPEEEKYWIVDGVDLFVSCYHNKKRYDNE